VKLKFKHQQFQMDAVNSVVACFEGQPKESSHFTLDRGIRHKPEQLDVETYQKALDSELSEVGFRNKSIQLTDIEILRNIQSVQRRNGLKISDKIERRLGEQRIINLTIEMETGTGKTYTYIRTMYELYKTYGWSKFIVVVPSIAIREGVLKTLQITEEHFMSEYGMKPRYFVYNSKQLHQIEQFASDPGISVMVINTQAFNARGKDARRIRMELDDFSSRKPIDVLASTNPILIIDEPQSVEGRQTIEALKEFNPLFILRYSATHREEFNKIYRLDAVDAYNKKLVKKISVKGISAKGTGGSDSYLYLEGISISPKHPPMARLEMDVRTKTGVSRKTFVVCQNDDLYHLSGNLEQYRGYKVSEINGKNNSISFINGVTLFAGDVQGDVGELHFRRIQIRETIKSHFEKERKLYHQGIKVLSLFFIDEVAKYRQYDEHGNHINGVYADIFEEEYTALLNEELSLFDDDPYIQYLKSIDPKVTHKGYFSIDKRTNRMVNPKVSARETDSDDESAYDLIMRDKERLLSFSEPTRFIFSHSALKEGWDNPNVFQICTLKHSDSTVKKRQEVGRGLRLCVNQNGERMDDSVPGIDVHDINVLTVIASESYEQFARQLQTEIAETLSDRPRKVDFEFFLNKVLKNDRGEQLKLDDRLAGKLIHAFIKKDYVDDNYGLTNAFFEDAENGRLKLPDELSGYQAALIELLQSVYVEGKTNLAEDERKINTRDYSVNENFYKKEFQELWNRINRKSVYTVKFDSDELIRKCIEALDARLHVPEIRFTVRHGDLKRIESQEQLQTGTAFEVHETRSETVEVQPTFRVKYDLVGKLMDETNLTRKTIVAILTGIKERTFLQFRRNPEEFMIQAARLINEQKASMVIESITYDILNDRYDQSIFTHNTLTGTLGENLIEVKKHIYNFVAVDSKTEKDFARELDASDEVLIYAKLPKGFSIPTPVGNYTPDWAIVFREGAVKYIYFIAETKGSLDSLELREVEKAKIECARRHFAKLNTDRLKYDVVNSYEKLLDIVKG
jgi:type III restriction enzyme